MPPPKSHKKLTAEQKDRLRRWIAAGAEYQPQWSLIPPQRPPVPEVRGRAWVRNPIDAFILAEQEKRGLQPAPEADRRTLARRLSLDLIGLPPEPAEVEAFVKDAAPDAYENYVDRLLRSPHWGEHRGRYWLDVARYADTHGIHFDNYREMWAYRDWVIGAFNRNLPFDQFTLEQLAGDLLPERTLDQQIASGFNRCNITTNEGGVIPEEYLVLYTRDRTETVAQAWLGLTAGCAVCHEHKFDPLSQREFYQLAAFFNNTTQAGLDGNIKDTPPIVVVPRPEDRPRWEALGAELAEIRNKLAARQQAVRAEFNRWLAGAGAGSLAAQLPQKELRFHAPLGEGAGQQLHFTEGGQPRTLALAKAPAWQPGQVAAKALQTGPDSSIAFDKAGDFDKDQPFSCSAWIKVGRLNQTGAIVARMQDRKGDYRGWDLWFENGLLGAHLVSKWDSDAIKVVSREAVKRNTWQHVTLTYDGSKTAAGVKLYLDGIPQTTTVSVDRLKSTLHTETAFKIGQRQDSSRLAGLMIQDVRLYGRALSSEEAGNLPGLTRAVWLASKPADQRSPTEVAELFDTWLPANDPPSRDLAARRSQIEREQAPIKAGGTVALVMQERPEMASAFLLFRGEYDKRRDKVEPQTPAALVPFPADLPKNRLGFARWLLRPEQPLPARVTVNRFWQEVFGTGIVRTSGDFGVSGDLPSHPDLLDWLAVDFRDAGWDMKRFFKLLVTSATYRQAALTTTEKLEKDGQNRLLSRGPRFRMDGEMIRDYALAASGLLVRKLGGPSVKPYQPEGVWEAVAMPESNTRFYKPDSGEGLYRRSLYTFWKRAAPPAAMDILNAPNRETCAVRRERTNTPLQALVTLNDTQFVEAARHLAQTTLQQGGDTMEARLDFLAGRLLARALRPEEAKVVRSVLDELLADYKAHPDEAIKLIAVGQSKADPKLDVPTLAAWTMVANQLLNLDEVLNK